MGNTPFIPITSSRSTSAPAIVERRLASAKLRFAFDNCRIRAGDRVLNIGEGWGGMLTYNGRRGVRHTGVTLNEESYKACLRKRDAEKLTDTCAVEKVDFLPLPTGRDVRRNYEHGRHRAPHRL